MSDRLHIKNNGPLRLGRLSARREGTAEGAAGALDGVDLTLAPGEWLYIVGTNGSGKSTLGRIVAGLGFPGELRAATWDRGFAGETPAPYVMQQPDAQLFGGTPREEIVFALEWLGVDGPSIHRLARAALEEAGLLEAADLPWQALSGGQRQLAAVAAAAAGQAPLLVLDEATSMLDGASQALVRRLVGRRHREGAAVVWITQRISELAPRGRVVALADGRLVYDGETKGFLFGEEAGEEAGEGAREAPPCVRCGLRLPFGAELSREIGLRLRERTRPHAAEENEVSERQPSLPRDSDLPAEPVVPLRFEGLQIRSDAESAQAEAAPLRLRPGAIAVLLGMNGAGKTRLLEIAAGLRAEEDVRASYADAPVGAGTKAAEVREAGLLAYSYACQSPEEQLFARTLEDEMQYVLRPYGLGPGERRKRMEEALRSVGRDSSWLARDPYAMSGGERRRAALACAMAAPAPWLLLDEPTAGLDAHGCDELAASLREERRRGRGILLVSHDPDWALPLADELLLLGADGAVRHCGRAELLAHPAWWPEAGLRIPEAYAASRKAWSLGMPEQLAWDVSRIADFMASGSARTADAGSGWSDSFSNRESVGENERAKSAMAARALAAEKTNRLSSFDPRAVWLGYVSFSMSVFAAAGWSGLTLSAAAAAAVVLCARLPLREYKGPLRAFALFAAAAAVLSGLTGDSGGPDAWWHAEDSLATFRSFAKTWLVLVIGIGLPAAIPPLRLRRALTQILPKRGAAGRRSRRIVLTVTLLLRFVPQLMQEWERFAGIAVARGKETRRTPAAMLRKLKSTAIPFMLSLFRLGETVTLALESRGVGRRDEPTAADQLRWRSRDSLLVAAAAIVSAGLVWQGRLF